ncbi:MAG: T9SS type A sorting domain-containing protein [Ignavibacteriales bacterium]|nr:T9SS type A sorting domain-containing protein [Ignavibacteriales bacterium]
MKYFCIFFLLVLITRVTNAQWTFNPNVNTAICQATGNQLAPHIVTDGAGGAIIAWWDNRGTSTDIYAQRIDASGHVRWTTNGVTIVTAGGNQNALVIVSDGLGGAIIAWQDNRNGTDWDIYSQRINALGQTLWTTNGLAISTAGSNQANPAIVSDGAGSAIITWEDNRSGTNWDIYAQRIKSYGVVHWTTNGVPICTVANDQTDPTIISDSSDGAIISWSDFRNGTENDIYAQRIDASAVVRWTADGVPISTALRSQNWPELISDGSGGAIITWFEQSTVEDGDIYAQRINNSGIAQWATNGVAISTATNNQQSPVIVNDGASGAIITWADYRSGTHWDVYTQRINASGLVQWTTDGVAISTGDFNKGIPGIASDDSGGAIIAWDDYRDSINGNIYAQRIDASGIVRWASGGTVVTTAPNTQAYNSIVSDGSHGAIITWADLRNGTDWNIYANKIGKPSLSVTRPTTTDVWRPGDQDTIRWFAADTIHWVRIDYSLDNGHTVYPIEAVYPADSMKYVWTVPDSLSRKCRIILTDFTDASLNDTSGVFKIKGYILTRLSPSGDYVPYNRFTDVWGFSNNEADMWPATWYNRFNYRSMDPYTGIQYSQWQGGGIFSRAASSRFPNWETWVKAFTPGVCYLSTSLGIYSPPLLAKWTSRAKVVWNGSCFGIAGTNALAFRHKDQFVQKFENFPAFTDPIDVLSDTNVIKAVTEIFTHQFGRLSQQNDIACYNIKTPTQTLNDLKQMLGADDAPIRTISLINNGIGGGGHTILPYKVERTASDSPMWNIYVYDNSYPDVLSAIIQIDTSMNSHNGVWGAMYGWSGWGGTKNFYLEIPSENYLGIATPSTSPSSSSPFKLNSTNLEVMNTPDASIMIYDRNGKMTGFDNNQVVTDVLGSTPFILKNGTKTPPYGYALPADRYVVYLDSFKTSQSRIFFSSGNRTYGFERSDADSSQTDFVYFDTLMNTSSGLQISNPDLYNKSITLTNIIDETSVVKAYTVDSLELTGGAMFQMENQDVDKLRLTNSSSEGHYNLRLEYATATQLQQFERDNIQMPANAVHIIEPNWSALKDSLLIILVDVDNDGTIDDTLHLQNILTDARDHGSLIPTDYKLYQCYPNPFNPVTTISYQLPVNSHVTLKVFDALGREVVTLVDAVETSGCKSVTFDASKLASGVYYYSLSAGVYVETKKLLLVK